ncbi:MAG: glycosyltransferase family 39 protein, partial [Anaerolineae bacterium]|nr:glycosyltransferase family 39 protein [Anaerolineae bacterium]
FPRSRPARIILIAILGAFLTIATAYSVTVPVFEASDELWHYPMVEVIARTWTLPVQPLEPGTTSGPWRQEGSQQPLYYALGAVLTFWIDTTDMAEARQPNPHARAGEITPERDNVNLVIHHPDRERSPWTGTVLAVHIVRLFSVLLGVWAVALTWLLVHELFPDTGWIPLAAAAVHAFTPMYLFITSSINNDNLTVPLCSLALLLMVRRVKAAGGSRDRLLYRSDLFLGIVVGLALLTKSSGLGLLPFVGATLAWETVQLPKTTTLVRRAAYFLSHLAVVLAPALAISAWWYARNLRLYGDLLGWRAFEAVLGTRDVPAGLGQLWAERFAFAAGYWGNFGGLNVPMPGWTYSLLNGLAVVAAAGLLVGFGRWILGRSHLGSEAGVHSITSRLWPLAWSPLTAAHALAWAWPVAIFVSWIRWATTTWSSQGRLIFPAIPMWSLALVLGLSAWVPRRGRSHKLAPAVGLSALLLGLTVVALPGWILPAYRPPKALGLATVPTGYQSMNATFGDTLELLGYRLNTCQAHPDEGLDIELLWRARQPTESHHSVFIHALGQGDRIVAQRDSFPGHGLLPTTQLAPGRVWTERHILRIPHTAYTPDTLSLAIGLYETATGERVLVEGVTAQPADGPVPGGYTIRFGSLPLVAAAESDGLEVRFGDGIVLDGYDVSGLVLQPGEQLEVILNWRSTAPVEHDYTVSVQVIDSQWNKAAQSDAWPLDGRRPTSSWSPGDEIQEIRALTIDPNAVPGAYDLRIALYRVVPNGSLEHLPVSVSREGMPAKTLVLTTLRVAE